MNNLKIENILKTLSILYIENDKNFINYVSEALNMKSHNLFIANDISQAVNIYNENKIDIIITESFKTNKHSINEIKPGIKFIKKIRLQNEYIPIIIITRSLYKEDLISLITLNITKLIYKPIDLLLLKEALYDSVDKIIKLGKYEIKFSNNTIYNVNKKILKDKDEILELTFHEIIFLDALIANRHHVITQETYKSLVWKDKIYVSDSAFKSLLNRLRMKIGKNSIINISGFGYRLEL